jgi:hypothetical protein
MTALGLLGFDLHSVDGLRLAAIACRWRSRRGYCDGLVDPVGFVLFNRIGDRAEDLCGSSDWFSASRTSGVSV